jgi:hypothetical protein
MKALLVPSPCCFSYAIQRLGHAPSVLSPVRVVLGHVPLGLRLWLHRLLRQSRGFVRRLPRYCGGVWLLASVHRRLKLIAVPARTGAAEAARPDPRPLTFRCAPFLRDGAFGHARATAPRNTGTAHVAFGSVNGLGLCDFALSRLN